MSRHFIDSIVSDNGKVLNFSAGTYDGDAIITDLSAYETAAQTAARVWTESDISDLQDYALDSALNSLSAAHGVTAAQGADLVSLTGVASGEEDMGSFSGSVIGHNSNIKEAMQDLETELELKASISYVDAHTWTESDITDLQDYALNSKVDEIDVNANDLISLSGVAENSQDLGTFSGATISDSRTIKQALQELETAVEACGSATSLNAVVADMSNMQTLSGMADESSDLGAFSGSVIPDAANIKSALQALETKVESVDSENSGQGRWFFADLAVGSAESADLIALSSGAHIMEMRVNTGSAFDGASPSITLGWASDNDAVVEADDFSVGAAGRSAMALPHKMSGSETVRSYVDGGGSAGACEVAILVVE